MISDVKLPDLDWKPKFLKIKFTIYFKSESNVVIIVKSFKWPIV